MEHAGLSTVRQVMMDKSGCGEKVNQAINVWGPAIIVCLTVVIGIVMNNRGIDAVNRRIDDLRSELTARIDDLRKDLTARIEGLEKRLTDRLERLEHPVLTK